MLHFTRAKPKAGKILVSSVFGLLGKKPFLLHGTLKSSQKIPSFEIIVAPKKSQLSRDINLMNMWFPVDDTTLGLFVSQKVPRS